MGSDIDNFRCPFCFCTDRERHLMMYFDKLEIWALIVGKNVLHIAPEPNIEEKLKNIGLYKYILGDISPSKADHQKIDITAINFKNGTFDFIMCNHVLEHVEDHKKALSELYRVLSTGGTAILQTPYSTVLNNNFEDSAITTPKLREVFHGQWDHVRTFSRRELFDEFRHAGFELEVIPHSSLFDENDARLHGVNIKEPLLLLRKR
ncbi:MAG: methyltransferase domain-containing protein [Saprospiraceae bacterium]